MIQVRQSLLGPALGLLVACLISACGPKNPVNVTHETGGTQEERVAEVSRLLSKTSPLPGSVLDAHFIEEQTGDGRLGPSDFAAFYAITVAPGDLDAWRSALPPMGNSEPKPAYAAPKQSPGWWITRDDFGKLKFFSPLSLTGRANGWVGVAPYGRIFVYAFTM